MTVGAFMRFFPAAVAALALGCASENYTQLYATQPIAPSLTWDGLEALDHMGPVMVDGGVNFTIYSERAERVEILFFDDPEADIPTWQVPLTNRNGGAVWSVFVEGIGIGQHYGFIAWGPNWPYDEDWWPGSTIGFRTDVDQNGNRFNPNKLLFDPWGKAIHRDHDWFKGSVASGPKRFESTWAAASKSVVVNSDYQWSDNESRWRRQRADNTLEGHDDHQLIIYEAHPKGLTANPSSGVEFPGTYRGIGEIAPYLKELGINVVELMPIHEKPLDGGYWGYNNLNFFAPEHTFSAEWQATGRVDEVIDEFKWMVDELHKHDIEVMIDVVYNHTGEGGLWRERLFFETYDDMTSVNFDPKEVAGLYSFRGLDNAAYYALSPDGQTYWNNTGVGNQTRPNHAPMRRNIMDSMHFMVEELHVDGFRFDLAGILGENDLDYNSPSDPATTILQDIIDDPVMQDNNVRIVSEPWTAAGTGPGIGGFPTSSDDPAYAWAEWNAHFRDWWRSFLNNDDHKLNWTEGLDGGSVMTGSQQAYGWNGRKPYHSINFITVHDGFTMYDLFSYEERQNDCGLLNPKCCQEPLSVWCDTQSGEVHNRSRNWGDEPTKRQMVRNMFTAMMISHGTPLLWAGDEWLRTQYGNNNAYNIWADNEWNWMRWGEWQSTYAWSRHRSFDFVKKLIQFRKDHEYAFAPKEYGEHMPLAWKNAYNSEMSGDDWSNNKHVMQHYYDDGSYSDVPELLVLINMERGDVTFSLPEGRTWGRVVDTQAWFDTPGDIDAQGGYFDENPTLDPYVSANISTDSPVILDSASYTVSASSIVILEEQ